MNLPNHSGYIRDEDFEVYTSQLNKRMKHLVNVLNHFWRRWRSEYLNELRESHCYMAKKASQPPHVTKGYVVIVHDDALPRGLWKLERIQDVFTGCLPRSYHLSWTKWHSQRGPPVVLACKSLQLNFQRGPPVVLAHKSRAGRVVAMASSAKCAACLWQQLSQEHYVPRRNPVPVRAAAKRANEKRKIWVQELQGRD